MPERKRSFSCYIIYDPELGYEARRSLAPYRKVLRKPAEVVNEFVSRTEALYPSVQGRLYVELPGHRSRRGRLLESSPTLEALSPS